VHFTHDGVKYSITFEYHPAEYGLGRSTYCRISVNSPLFVDPAGMWDTYVAARTWCHPTDKFVKETGRKLALAQALSLVQDRAFRRVAWECYLGRGKSQKKTSIASDIEPLVTLARSLATGGLPFVSITVS
jgi:hypothetical protein